MGSKVFVGNLEFRTTSQELESLFAQVGPIREVFLPTDRNTGRPRGFAFVEFESEDDVQKAIDKFNGHELGGRPLRVNAAEDRPPRGDRPSYNFNPDFQPMGGPPGGGNRFGGGGKSKGSRRNIRARKRSL
jgi:RNA recognition motif-containing protein